MRLNRVLMVTALVLAAQVAMAEVYTFQPTPADIYDLDHHKAYRWGIDTSIPDCEDVIGASIFFDDIRNWDGGTNDLWVTLLDTAPAGLTVYCDSQGGGDKFYGWGPRLVHYHNLPTSPQDITYTFDAAEVAALDSYVADDNVGLGFDPDCHYWNEGITLTIETESHCVPIPEPMAGSILLGGIGMIVARRKRR